MKIAINGLGRIGKSIIRCIFELDYNDIEIHTINSSNSIKNIVHALKYDSINGKFPFPITHDDEYIYIKNQKIKKTSTRNPKDFDCTDIDILFECTGSFNDGEKVKPFLDNGARKIIISAPADNIDATICYGVNEELIKNEHKIISIGSCTTNCLGPIAFALNNELEILKGFVTTVHSYTNDQVLIDANHNDLRRSRAAALSMIPTKTGAASQIGKIIPILKGKLDGSAIRVPTANVSMIDFSCLVNKRTSINEINEIIKNYSLNKGKNIVSFTDEPLVSIDFMHNTHSAIYDSLETKVVDGNFLRVIAWYDNEWAFSTRMLDVARRMK